jgi:hypothetical protein
LPTLVAAPAAIVIRQPYEPRDPHRTARPSSGGQNSAPPQRSHVSSTGATVPGERRPSKNGRSGGAARRRDYSNR